jgi:hypothetical protein
MSFYEKLNEIIIVRGRVVLNKTPLKRQPMRVEQANSPSVLEFWELTPIFGLVVLLAVGFFKRLNSQMNTECKIN